MKRTFREVVMAMGGYTCYSGRERTMFVHDLDIARATALRDTYPTVPFHVVFQ